MRIVNRHNERRAEQNASQLEQAVKSEYWFSTALDKLRKSNTNEMSPSSNLPQPNAPSLTTPPPPVSGKHFDTKPSCTMQVYSQLEIDLGKRMM